MKYVVQINRKGYKALQDHIMLEIEKLGIQTKEEKERYLEKYILVKEDKKHRTYHYFDLLENLKNMPADEFA
jgi:hypothetical protein